MRAGIKSLGAIVFVLGVAGCAAKPVPVKVAPPPPPPPPPVVVILPPPPPPAMPVPPLGAALSTQIPPLGIDGVRVTPNRGISREEQIWNFRAAMNVAALNCRDVAWDQMIPLYTNFLNTHKTRLNQANNAVDAEYKRNNPGKNGLRVRDTQTTAIYNYFSFPPLRVDYCNMALAKLTEANALPSTALPEYAMGALADVDSLFIRFFDAFVQYERDLVDWNLRFGPNAIQPAVSAVPVTTSPVVITSQPTVPAATPPKPTT